MLLAGNLQLQPRLTTSRVVALPPLLSTHSDIAIAHAQSSRWPLQSKPSTPRSGQTRPRTTSAQLVRSVHVEKNPPIPISGASRKHLYPTLNPSNETLRGYDASTLGRMAIPLGLSRIWTCCVVNEDQHALACFAQLCMLLARHKGPLNMPHPLAACPTSYGDLPLGAQCSRALGTHLPVADELLLMICRITDFWGPVSNFGIPIAAIADAQKSPDLYVLFLSSVIRCLCRRGVVPTRVNPWPWRETL